jgi:hypothetical protein
MKVRLVAVLCLSALAASCNTQTCSTKCNGVCVDLTSDSDHCGACGTVCAAGETCKAGSCALSCTSSEVACGTKCVDPKTDPGYCGAQGDCGAGHQGAACSTGQVCSNGSCVACVPNAACDDSSNACLVGALSCTNGPVCQNKVSAANGKSCGTDQVCSSGQCVGCVVDEVCTPAVTCKAGKRTCSGGPACQATTNFDAGTACGSGMVCNASAQCVACTQAASCVPTNGCHQGRMDCSAGATCVDQGTAATDGTTCPGTAAYNFCSSGTCTACTNGGACIPTNKCHKGTLTCTSSPPTCTDSNQNQVDGTACGDNQSCLAGVCLTNDRVLTVTSGDGQSAAIDAQLAATVNVHLVDGNGTAVPSTTVTVTADPGAHGAASAVTDGSGNAKIVARVGRAVGTYHFTATAPGVVSGASFTATATAPAAKSIFTVVDVAHTSGYATVPGPGTTSKLYAQVKGVAAKADGTLYLADYCSIYTLSKAGVMTLLAGTANSCGTTGDGGPATAAKVYYPHDLALDEARSRLYFGDNQRVRFVDLATGNIYTLAGGNSAANTAPYGDGGQADQAYLSPTRIGVAPNGDVYISDGVSSALRKVDYATTIISTVMASATCTTEPTFAGCSGEGCSMAWDSSGQLFVSGYFCTSTVGSYYGVARVGAANAVTLVAGTTSSAGSQADGVAAITAYFPSVPAIAFDQAGNLLLLLRSNHKVRRVDAATTKVTTLVGTGTAGFLGDYVDATTAQLNYPAQMALDGAGTLYLADDSNYAVRSVWQLGDTTPPTVKMVSPSGAGQSVPVNAPFSPLTVTLQDGSSTPIGGVNVTWDRQTLGSGIISAPVPNTRLVAKTNATTGVSVMTGRVGLAVGTYTFTASYADIHGTQATGSPATFTVSAVGPTAGTIFTVQNVYRNSGTTGFPGPATFAMSGNSPAGAVAASDGTLYLSSQCAVLKVSPAGEASVFAGTLGGCGTSGDEGPATSAKLYYPSGLALDETRGVLYIADTSSQRIRSVTLSDGKIHTLAGGQTGLSSPYGDGGDATLAQLSNPSSVSVDPSGDIYIVDSGHSAIRVVNHSTGIITTWLSVAAACTGAINLRGILGSGGTSVVWSGTSGDAYISGQICGTDTNSNTVYGIVLRAANGTLTRIAGAYQGSTADGVAATLASLPNLSGIALAPNGDLAVATYSDNRVRVINASSKNITTVAGTGAPTASTPSNDYVEGRLSPVYYPMNVAYTAAGHLVIPEYQSSCFRMVW